LDGFEIGAARECDNASSGNGAFESGGQCHSNIPLGLIHWFRQYRSVVASRPSLNSRAHMHRNTVAHEAKFARRMQLNCADNLHITTILPQFTAWKLIPR
jgi:hypothetical protein